MKAAWNRSSRGSAPTARLAKAPAASTATPAQTAISRTLPIETPPLVLPSNPVQTPPAPYRPRPPGHGRSAGAARGRRSGWAPGATGRRGYRKRANSRERRCERSPELGAEPPDAHHGAVQIRLRGEGRNRYPRTPVTTASDACSSPMVSVIAPLPSLAIWTVVPPGTSATAWGAPRTPAAKRRVPILLANLERTSPKRRLHPKTAGSVPLRNCDVCSIDRESYACQLVSDGPGRRAPVGERRTENRHS